MHYKLRILESSNIQKESWTVINELRGSKVTDLLTIFHPVRFLTDFIVQ